MSTNIEIKCPKCEWKPDGGAYWHCECGNQWNTFATTGRCPKCKKMWKDTQCPGPEAPGGCGKWSPHIDWYHNLGDKLKEELEKAMELTEV